MSAWVSFYDLKISYNVFIVHFHILKISLQPSRKLASLYNESCEIFKNRCIRKMTSRLVAVFCTNINGQHPRVILSLYINYKMLMRLS
jgi:hypothetical protein